MNQRPPASSDDWLHPADGSRSQPFGDWAIAAGSAALAAWLPVAIDPDPESRRQILTNVVGYLAVSGYREIFTAAGFGETVDKARGGADPSEPLAALPLEAASTVGLVGNVKAVEDCLEPTPPPGSTRSRSSQRPQATPAASAP